MGFRCPVCALDHEELPALVLTPPEPADASVSSDATEDLCMHDNGQFFVRCVLELPIHHSDEVLHFGVWSSLSRDNFLRYRESLGDPVASARLEPMFSWFSSELPGYPDTIALKCRVLPRPDGLRPLIELEPTDHPLAVQQRDGLSLEEAMRYLHDYVDL